MAQGVELLQASIPSTSSFSNLSSATNDTAPQSPSKTSNHAAFQQPEHSQYQATLQPQQAQPPPPNSTTTQTSIYAQEPTQLETASSSAQPDDQLDDPRHVPQLASSDNAVLSDHLEDSSRLLGKDSMLHSHQHAKSEIESTGLSPGAVQTGFRAAGMAGLNEGMSEAITEAIEVQSPATNGLHADSSDDEPDIHAGDKGRLMKVYQALCLMMVTKSPQVDQKSQMQVQSVDTSPICEFLRSYSDGCRRKAGALAKSI